MAAGVQSSTPRRVDRTPLDERRRGRRAGLRAADVLGEQHPAEAHLRAQHEVLARLVPHDRLAPLHLVGERVDQLVGVERRAEADARVVPLAVEVGGHHEPVPGEGIVGRGPRACTGAQLEPAGLAAAHGDPVRVGQRQECASALGADVVDVEACPGAPGEVGRAVAHPGRRRADRHGRAPGR